MEIKNTDLKRLQEEYDKSGNGLVILYGRTGCQKEKLIREFVSDKKYFYTDADRHQLLNSVR